jgi:hypothetical protein
MLGADTRRRALIWLSFCSTEYGTLFSLRFSRYIPKATTTFACGARTATKAFQILLHGISMKMGPVSRRLWILWLWDNVDSSSSHIWSHGYPLVPNLSVYYLLLLCIVALYPDGLAALAFIPHTVLAISTSSCCCLHYIHHV